MKLKVLSVLSVCLLCIWGGAKATPASAKMFRGAWFDIRDPASFKARSGMPSSTSGDGCDSAFFVSPDKRVEFYVFSPQWGGEPKDYVLKPQQEVVVAKREQTIKRGIETIAVTWMTVRAKNKGYSRSWVDKRNLTTHCRLVFGIKYANPASLAKYRRQFAAFKNSLSQYAD